MELGLSLVLCVFCAAVIKTEGRTQQGVSQGMVERGEREREGGTTTSSDNNRGDNCKSEREAEHASELKRQLTFPSDDR